MALSKLETRVYVAGKSIQASRPKTEGVLLRELVDTTGYALSTVHRAVRGLTAKRHAGWPLKNKNSKKGALRFWEVPRKSA